MKKQFSVKLANGEESIFGCDEDALETILSYHYSGEQLETATINEIPQPPITNKFRTLEKFSNSLYEPIAKVFDLDKGKFLHYKQWQFEKINAGILATPSPVWRNSTPVLIETPNDLIELCTIIDGLQA